MGNIFTEGWKLGKSGYVPISVMNELNGNGTDIRFVEDVKGSFI